MYIHNSNSSIRPHPGGGGGGIYFQDSKTGCVCVLGGRRGLFLKIGSPYFELLLQFYLHVQIRGLLGGVYYL